MNKRNIKCEHPECGNLSLKGICEPHISLIAEDESVVSQCANCGSFVGVYDKSVIKVTNVKYVHCLRCRNCGGTKADEKLIYAEYPLSGRIVKGDEESNAN